MGYKGRGIKSPEFWDAVFKPRGPLGLLGGQTFLGMIPGVGQGMSYIDAKQGLKEGDPLLAGLGVLGMAPGGKTFGKVGTGIADIVDLAKRRAPKPPPETRKEAFDRLAYGQRGEPEKQMGKAVRRHQEDPWFKNQEGVGVYNTLLEHVGDLTHRMAEHDAGFGKEFVLPKIDRALWILENPVDSKAIKNLQVAPEVQDYVKAHQNLPVFNNAQKLARDAAIDIGNQNIPGAINKLKSLRRMMDVGSFDYVSKKFDPAFEIKGGKAEIFDENVLDSYRAWKKSFDPLPEESLTHDEFLNEFSATNHVQRIKYAMNLIDSLQKKLDSFVKPGKLTHGNAKDIQDVYKKLESKLNDGSFPRGDDFIEAIEEFDDILGGLDEAGAITSTDQVVDMVNAFIGRWTIPQ